MKVVIITQDDPFFIPRNVALVCRDPHLHVLEVIVLDSRGSLSNMRWRLVQWFGVGSVARLALRRAALAARRGERTIAEVARRCGVPYSREPSVNDERILDRLERSAPDVIVSFSAPQVFCRRLLEIPRHGCINLHCSLLPQYRGLLPSFWVLANGEAVTGATVHRMAAGIDDGDILAQREVDIREARTMFEVLNATKRVGGELMLDTLHALRTGAVQPMPNRTEEGSYFSWPNEADARRFRQRGLRLA